MTEINKPVSACCDGQVFLLRDIRKEVANPLEMEVELQKPLYGCRVCGKECEVMEDK